MVKLNVFSLLLLLAHIYQPSSAFATPVLNAELTSVVAKINSGEKGNKGTVLVVISSADSIPLQNGKPHKTGYFLRELTDPLKEVVLAGYDVEFATPGGKTPVVALS